MVKLFGLPMERRGEKLFLDVVDVVNVHFCQPSNFIEDCPREYWLRNMQ